MEAVVVPQVVPQGRTGRWKAPPAGLLVLPAVLLLLVLFAYPVAWLLLRSFSMPKWGWGNFVWLFAHPVYLRVLLNTALISGTCALCCAAIGYPFAYTMATGSERTRQLLGFAILLPFWTSILVRSFAWIVLLQRAGLINQILLGLGLADHPVALIYNRVGTLIGMVQVLLPFLVLPLYSFMLRINPIYLRAATTLGASPGRAFLRIYLPLSMPGLMAGSTLVFIIALGYFITPALLGGAGDTMVAQLIQQEVANFGNWGHAGALAVLLLGGTALVLFVTRRLFSAREAWSVM
jgi:putative spermidine/putrescine transport system permease protein